MEIFLNVLKESLKVTLFVMAMMLAVDLINVKTKGKLEAVLKSSGRWKQYVIAALLGASPGCLGAFAGVSLYMHGMLSFGALAGLMFATAGDEQFVMLALFPDTALVMFLILFFLGIVVGFLSDYLIKKFNIKTCTDCEYRQYHPGQEGYKHYFREHIWLHILKGHLVRIFLWTFGALLIIEYGMKFIDLERITAEYSFMFLLFSGVIGLIPESGPHLIFVTLFAKGLIPFSILFTSSIVQDGHGMLPLLAFSVKDSVLIKTFNLIFGLVIGIILYLAGS
ncbi:MAG: putative manganese transporter [Ignavibacteriaceae bacterium]